MKKKLLIIAVLFLSASSKVSSQTEFGVKSGLNFSKYSKSVFGAEYQYRIGFYAGGFFNYKINDKFKLQTELLFAQQGSNLVIKDVVIREFPDQVPVRGDFKSKIIESTIAIPILAQYYVADKIYVEAGPQFGFIIKREEEITESPIDDPSFNNVSEFDYDSFSLGFSIGSGYELNEKLTFNFRYYFGLLERDLDVKLSVFNLGIEYRL